MRGDPDLTSHLERRSLPVSVSEGLSVSEYALQTCAGTPVAIAERFDSARASAGAAPEARRS